MLLKKKYKGNTTRLIKKAESLGYYVKLINKLNHTLDMHELIHSTPVRGGQKMPDWLLQSIDQLGGIPKLLLPTETPACPVHFSIDIGVFVKVPGHTQGDIITNEKLVGYITTDIIGDTSYIKTIYGHKDHLDFGVMYLLHLELVRLLYNYSETKNINTYNLVYAGFGQGGEGRPLWKKRMLYEPTFLYTLK